MVRYTIPSAWPVTAGRLANKKRNGFGKLNTHWRIGCSAKTSSTSSAARSALTSCVLQSSAMRPAPQLAQKPRRLQLNVTRCSAWHLLHRHCLRSELGLGTYPSRGLIFLLNS